MNLSIELYHLPNDYGNWHTLLLNSAFSAYYAQYRYRSPNCCPSVTSSGATETLSQWCHVFLAGHWHWTGISHTNYSIVYDYSSKILTNHSVQRSDTTYRHC